MSEYYGSSINNPYSYSQVAVTWYELIGQANAAFGGSELEGTFFNSWLLALITATYPGYVLTGPTIFSWGQVVLANPVATQYPVGTTTVSGNQVFNINLSELSAIQTNALWFVPPDFVPSGVVPI